MPPACAERDMSAMQNWGLHVTVWQRSCLKVSLLSSLQSLVSASKCSWQWPICERALLEAMSGLGLVPKRRKVIH